MLNTCTNCKKTKDMSEFVTSRRSPKGKINTCLECNREYSRRWYKNKRKGMEDKRFKPRDIPLEERVNILLTSGVCLSEEEALKFIKNI